MRILLTGCSGQLGTELRPFLAGRGELTTTDVSTAGADDGTFIALDLADAPSLNAVLDEVRPQLIVNAAAYTAVDRAESDQALAFELNAAVPEKLADWAECHDTLLVHYSTDYVFDGNSERPYRESDLTSPINVYGASKLAGEQAIAGSGCRHVILRTSWLYSRHGQNFLRTMLRLARERTHLRIVADQRGCPTWARNLARVSDQLIAAMATGEQAMQPVPAGQGNVFHYCDSTASNWYDFASLIFDAAVELGLLENRPEIEAVDSNQFQTEARRPRYSVLDTSAIRDRLQFTPAELSESVRACLEEMTIDE